MSLELKFRAWHNVENRWIKSQELLNEIQVSATIVEPSRLSIEHELWTFEQSMNQKDVNGELIFVGDIIKFVFFYYAEYETEVHKTGTVCLVDGIYFTFMVSDEEMYDFSQLNYDSLSDIEIIGNIHQNKELLS